jgi:hypothetical protein
MSDAFLGYNHNLRISESEFYDMQNMTSDFYPVLSPRKQRGVYETPFPLESPNGLIAKDALCYIDGSYFVMNQYRFDMGLSNGPKQLVSMGANVIILPDKKYFNTQKMTHGDIEKHITTTGRVTFELCMVDGAKYDKPTIDADEPSNPENMELWMDISSTPHTLKQYSSSSKTWVPIATTYVKITCAGSGIGETFKQYDGVTISGITPNGLQDLNSTTSIWSCAGDSIVVTGILDEYASQDTPICISRWMPNFDILTESKNRLWGCFYGFPYMGKAYNVEKGITEDVYGEEAVNEIYACKQGDFENWNTFMGLSTDSYVVSVGTDGQFTGAITHHGYPCFFKENVLHKVYGDYPSNYRVQDTACRGVQKGCSKSLAIVNEVLFYKSRSGVCAYDGSLPGEVSYQFGNELYSQAVGGAHGNKYYISMMDAYGQYNLFVYDTANNMWHKEDDLKAECFCSCDGELYTISGGQIVTLLGSGTKDTEPVEWMVQTGEIGMSSPDMKYISRMNVRMALAIGATVEFYIQYDLSDEWEHICTMTGTSLRSFSVPVRPKRCDHMKLKLVGKGEAKIYSITKTIEQGSELS